MSASLEWVVESAPMRRPGHQKKHSNYVREKDWEDYDAIIIDLRNQGETAKAIQEVLKENGFRVGISRLKHRLHLLLPKNRKREPRGHLALKVSRVRKETGASGAPGSHHTSVLNPDLSSIEGLSDTIVRVATAPLDNGKGAVRTDNVMDIDFPMLEDQGIEEDRVVRILVSLRDESDADFEGGFMIDVFEVEDTEGDEAIAARMLQLLRLDGDPDGISHSAAANAVNPQSSSANHLDGVIDPRLLVPPDGRVTDVLCPPATENKGYTVEELLAIAQDLPNWWSYEAADAVDMLTPMIELCASVDEEYGDHVGTRFLEALQIIATVSMRRLAQNERIPVEFIDAAKVALRMVSLPDFEVPPHILANFHYEIGFLVWERMEVGQDAKGLLLKAQQLYESCGSHLPAKSRADWFRTRLTLADSPFIYKGAGDWDDGEAIRITEDVLRDLTEVKTQEESIMKFDALRTLACRQAQEGRYSFLRVLEKLWDVLPRDSYSYLSQMENLVIDLLEARELRWGLEKRSICDSIRAYEILRKSNAQSYKIVQVLLTLAKAFNYAGRFPDARAVLRHIIKRQSKLYDEDNPMFFSHYMLELGRTYHCEKRFSEALRTFERVLNVYLLRVEEDEGSRRDPFYAGVCLTVKDFIVDTLEARGIVMYAQPMMDDLVLRYIHYYRSISDNRTWDVILKQMAIHSAMGNISPLITSA